MFSSNLSEVANSKSTAKLIPFPGDRLIGKARHVADLYLAKSEKAQKNYWCVTQDRYLQSLLKVGVSKLEAETSLERFRDAVQRELDNQNQRKV